MGAIDSGLKRAIFSSPALLGAVNTAKAIRRGLLLPIHDPDFHALKALPRLHGGLALDIGASSGQSAASILAVRPDMRVMCFEPNPACHQALRLTARLLDKAEVVEAGVGDAAGELPFYIPVRSNRPLLEEGTFQREALETSGALKRNGKAGVDYELIEQRIPIVTIDSLDLNPAFVKIDVQGFELEALRGMEQTLRRCKPVLLMEQGMEKYDFHKYLAGLGYRPHYWDGSQLQQRTDWDALNVFFL